MVTLREYSDAELAAIEPVEVEPGHLQNPFKPHLSDPLGAKLARRWSDIHWNQGEEDTGDLPNDPLDALAGLLAQDAFSWYRIEHPATGAIGIFPHTATDVAAWEERALAMTAAQVPVEVEEKPVMAYHDYVASLRRGD